MNAISNQPRNIFLAAIRLPRDEQDPYLDEACGSDAVLRRRVVALIQAHFAAGPIEQSDGPDLTATLTVPTESEILGTMIGPYKLREVLGEGGMGTVYVAEQQQPMRRKVALKVIKPGMDSREVIARFEAERQALALMDHLHIATVFDAGTTESGRPYFAMELIRGMPITDYCDRASVDLRGRMELFVKVCQAVEHAHQKGVIHRDLKPSNLMITLHDGVPVPKVIDFGVAKAINQRLTEHSVYTGHSQMLGTPLYMSPEQAELSGLDVDARSDVYSLGVLLYELLTGTTPFDKETMSRVGLDEMRRMIREDEPLRPSHRVGTLAVAKLSTVSESRGLDSRRLTHALTGDLDWIVMKALEKDRSRRYESASALAADVQRYLDDQPVHACPPSLGYRLRKFVRRNRRAMTMAILAVCIPLTALVVFMLTLGPDGAQQSQTALAASELPTARAPGRELPGLVPEPLLIPEVGRWQLITKRPRGVMRSAVWSPDEKRFALAEANHVRIYDATNLQLLHVFVAHSQPVTSVAWHPDGQRLASASEDGTVRLWTSEGAPTYVLTGHSGPVYRVAWRADGEQLASASADGTVRLWSADGGPVRVLDEAGRHVFGIDWSPDGKQLASVGGDIRPPGPDGNPGDNGVRIWDADSGSLVRKIDSSVKHSALCVDWRPDGTQLAVGYGDVYRSTGATKTSTLGFVPGAGVRLWNIDGTPGATLIRDPGSESTAEYSTINAVAWDPTGIRLAFGSRLGVVRIWNADDQSVTDTKPYHDKDLYSISWKRDGSRMLTTSRDSVGEWSADTGGTELIGKLSPQGFQVVKWSPDGKLIASAGLFWDADGKPAKQPEHPASSVPAWWESSNQARRPDETPGATLEGSYPAMREWAWNKNGWLAGATWADATVRIWNEQGKLIATLKDHRGGVESVDWSSDGEILASGGGDSVRLWKQDGTPGPVMTGHTDEVYAVAWSPDGRWIASAGTDSTIRLWKPDGTPGRVFRGHQGGLHDIAWSPDSRRLVSGSWLDSTLRVWNVETGKTEWQAMLLAPNTAITLSAAGEPLHGDRDLLDSGMLYLVEKRDGTMDIFSFSDFWKRYAAPLLEIDGKRISLLTQAGKLDEAVAIFDRVSAYSAKGDLALPAVVLNNLAWFLATRNHSALRDSKRGLELAEKAVASTPNDGMIWNTLGVAQYRAGDWQTAIESLTKSYELLKEDHLSFNGFFLAMAHWQMDRKDEAVQWYDKAVEWMEKIKSDDEELRRFRAEAAALLGVPEATKQPTTEEAQPVVGTGAGPPTAPVREN